MSLVRFHEPPFAEHLGLRTIREEGDEPEVLMPFMPALQNRKGDIHGGAIASLVDNAMGIAARIGLDRDAAASTLSMTVNFLSPARGDLRCIARCTKKGRTIRFVECEVLDRQGEVVATAVATFKIFAGGSAGQG